MLIRFAVENYNSFKERQVFSMAAGKQTRHPSHCLTINGKRLLKCSFFFGANASGKTNIIKAFDVFKKILLSRIDNLYIPNKLNKAFTSTFFELSFFVKNKEFTCEIVNYHYYYTDYYFGNKLMHIHNLYSKGKKCFFYE